MTKLHGGGAREAADAPACNLGISPNVSATDRGSSIMHAAISAKLGTPCSLLAIKAAARDLSCRSHFTGPYDCCPFI